MRKLRATRAMGLLDAWLANPQTIISGAIMACRQSKAETRAAIIACHKELN